MKCPPGTCQDVLMRGGKRIRCIKCGEEFPCNFHCKHWDCCSVRGDALPSGVTCEGPAITLEECMNK